MVTFASAGDVVWRASVSFVGYPHDAMPPLLAAIFVGGRAARMGGVAKGLLRTPSGLTIVERWRGIFERLSIPCVLVERRGEGEGAYAALGLPTLVDDPSTAGPLAGLLALLAEARARHVHAITVACDMPHVSERLVRRLAELETDAAVIAPRRDAHWEPFFARWDASKVLPIAEAHARDGTTSLQSLIASCPAHELPLDEAERNRLRDWDSPADVTADS